MKIGIDCRMLGPAQGGLGRYVEQLVQELSRIDFVNEYVLFVRKENCDAVKIASEQFNYTKVIADIPWYGWREQFLFPGIIKKQNVELMHFPHWNVPLLYRKKFVVTVHDLLLMHFPTRAASTLGPVAYWFKTHAYKMVLKNAVVRSAHIIVPSEFTKHDIAKTFGVEERKMSVTYQAPVKISLNNNSQLISGKRYLLYVGVAYPHKNLERLLDAWKLVQEKTNNEYQLVLAGKKNYFYDRLEKKIHAENITDVVLTGYVSDEELFGLYHHASLYVFPSLYEGFGLPPLEAWTHDIPVAASNRTCLPEILGQGALYFDPESVSHMADTIVIGLKDQSMRSLLRLEARHELVRYSGIKMAEKTLAIYGIL
jgi:glycosyltransferase involved in cell wall biosynthesis